MHVLSFSTGITLSNHFLKISQIGDLNRLLPLKSDVPFTPVRLEMFGLHLNFFSFHRPRFLKHWLFSGNSHVLST